PHGALEFLFRVGDVASLFGGKSGELLRSGDCAHGGEQYSADQCEWAVVAGLSALSYLLVRSGWGVFTGGERSPGVREHGSRLDDSAGNAAVGILCERKCAGAG